MAYLRFLTNKDYISIATEEHMRQIIRDVPDRVPQAEQRAEMQLLEYLDQYYEIEKVLAVGKNIRDYNEGVTYPANVWIKIKGEIYKTLTSINGYKMPSTTPYWKQLTDFISPIVLERARKYSQLRTYAKGEVVMFGTEYFECLIPHGYESSNIHMPGVDVWKEVETLDWEPNLEWEKDQVCFFNGNFYQYIGDQSTSDEDTQAQSESEVEEGSGSADDVPMLTPEEDDAWGLIGDYDRSYQYDFSEGARDYVVFEDTVFYPIGNPNADKVSEGVNITRDDPRNQNIVAHLARISLYHLHMIISPTNISETRRWAYEDSIQWLYNASKFKINPQLPRKREKDSYLPKVDWACETFQREYNPHVNAWLI